ncbi:MAG: phosphosulfolactate synthase [Halobacteriales archaeon]|nr:phosphosulfolactate synthase [Halobacteriales archaeon]
MQFLEDVVASRAGKPRTEGVTQVVDKFQGLELDTLAPLAAFVDVVKIRWGLPLVADRAFLKKRIRAYHDLGIQVSTGGTLTELAVRAGRFPEMLQAASAVGFDIVELSDGTFPLGAARWARLLRQVRQAGLVAVVKAGRKDAQRQPGADELARAVAQALDLGAPYVAIEAADGQGVGIYRDDGTTTWSIVDQLTSRFAPRRLLFEAPLEAQQGELVLHFGPDVNLGAVEIGQLASLECMRLGMGAGQTFGAPTRPRLVQGSPAMKFVYHLVRSEPLADQAQLVARSGLPRRTVQLALDALQRQGLVMASPNLSDTRRKVYRAV